MKKGLFTFTIPIVLIAALFAHTFADGPAPYVPGQVIVQLKPAASADGLRARGFAQVDPLPQAEYELVAPRPGQTVIEAVAELSARSDVLHAQPNYIYRGLSFIPNDPFYSQQWHLPLINAPLAWTISMGSSSETIAIIDSGADTNHVDLAARIVKVPGADIIEGDDDVSDTPGGSGHGTRVAGVAAAIVNNGVAVAGVDSHSRLLLIRVLSGVDAVGTTVAIDSGIRKAIEHKASVINLSLGFSSASLDLAIENSLIAAEAAGIIVVAAAGNDGGSPVIFPASSTRTIAVGATNSSDARSWFSNYGAASGLGGIDVMAPGQSVLTIGMSTETQVASGTSFAAPIVAAAATLVRAVRPGITPAQFCDFLRASAKDVGAAGYDEFTGPGRIDLLQLLKLAGSRSEYGDSFTVGAIDTRTVPIETLGRQGANSIPLSASDSFAGFFQKHYADTGTIQFYFKPDSSQPSETRFIVTQRGNAARAAGHLDLVLATDNTLRFSLHDSATLTNSIALNPDQWYHIGLSYGPSGMTLFVNGDSVARASGITGGPPRADTLYFGAPASLGNAQSVRGRLCRLGFSASQAPFLPSALTTRGLAPASEASAVGTVRISWNAWQTETNQRLVAVYVDTDQQGFNGTLLADTVVDRQYLDASLAALTLGQRYYPYVVVTDSTTVASLSPERAYAYTPAGFIVGTPPVVTVGGSSGSSGGGCLLSRLPGPHRLLRAWRDALLASSLGRLVTAAYYRIAA
jgi:subtilisin family serine protease